MFPRVIKTFLSRHPCWQIQFAREAMIGPHNRLMGKMAKVLK